MTSEFPIGSPISSRRAGDVARRMLVSTLGAAVMLSVGPMAHADNLDDKRSQIDSRIQRNSADQTASSDAVDKAEAALSASQAALTDARSRLESATSTRNAAQREDRRLAGELASAEADLVAARAATEQARADVEAQQKVVGVNVREATQQNTQLLSIGVLIGDYSTSDVNNRLQWSDTLFSATQSQLDALEEAQMRLEAAEAKQVALEASVREQREAAAGQLARTQELEAAAERAAREVSGSVAANTAAQEAAKEALRRDQSEGDQLLSELSSVQEQIRARNAAAEAAERAAAEEAARQNKPAAAPERPVGSDNNAKSSAGSLLLRPVDARISSVFGNRFHPVLGVWRYHNGVDYAASCGTPVLAGESGTVASVGYSGGAGNMIVVDYGKRGGAWYSASHMHLSGYAVSAGQRVSRGQVLGYVGTTGLSTGCHLHFGVWKNGSFVDPQSVT